MTRDGRSAPDGAGRCPEELGELCRRGIEGCEARDAEAVRRVLMALIEALNFDYRDAANRLFEVYDVCLRRVDQRQFQLPFLVLSRMRMTIGAPPP